MTKFYGYDENGGKWRFLVEGCDSWMCGNFYHNVAVERKFGNRYETIDAFDVHACEDALDAAVYAASKYGVQVAC